MTRIHTIRDLKTWVHDRIGSNATDADIEKVVDRISRDPKSPNWGEDWSEYLATLPMLIELA